MVASEIGINQSQPARGSQTYPNQSARPARVPAHHLALEILA